jgi:hypothetical protein
MQGDLIAESRLGQGSTFTIIVPARPGSGAREEDRSLDRETPPAAATDRFGQRLAAITNRKSTTSAKAAATHA